MPHGVCDDAIAEQALFNGTLALLSIIFFTPHLFLYRSGPIILVLQKAKNSVKTRLSPCDTPRLSGYRAKARYALLRVAYGATRHTARVSQRLF